jgi:hypothetical protein
MRMLLPLSRADREGSSTELAMQVARTLDLEIHALFIEDEELLALSDVSFVRDISPLGVALPQLDRRRVERDLRREAVQARRLLEDCAARGRITFGFDVKRGDPVAILASAMKRFDMVAVGPGFGCKSNVLSAGVFRRDLTVGGGRDLRLIPRVSALILEISDTRAFLEVALHLTENLGGVLELALTDKAKIAREVSQRLSALGPTFPNVSVETVALGVRDRARWVRGGRRQLLILPLHKRQETIQSLSKVLAGLRGPALLFPSPDGERGEPLPD